MAHQPFGTLFLPEPRLNAWNHALNCLHTYCSFLRQLHALTKVTRSSHKLQCSGGESKRGERIPVQKRGRMAHVASLRSLQPSSALRPVNCAVRFVLLLWYVLHIFTCKEVLHRLGHCFARQSSSAFLLSNAVTQQQHAEMRLAHQMLVSVLLAS